MKRAIVFLTVLCLVLVVIVSAEYFYSKDLKKHTNGIISVCEQNGNFTECAKDLSEIMNDRKVINRLFYSRDTASRILSEIKKLEVFAKGEQTVDAKAQLESIKLLFKTLYRFNANEA